MSEHANKVRVNYEICNGFALKRKVCVEGIHIEQTRIGRGEEPAVCSTKAKPCDNSCREWSNTYVQEMGIVPKEIRGLLCGAILGTRNDPLQLKWAIKFTSAAVDFVF
jgi:hypothetical protein